MTRTVVVMFVLAVVGTAVGWLARAIVTRESSTGAVAPPVNESAVSVPTPSRPSSEARIVPPRQPRDPRPLLLADVYSREEVDRSSTDAIFVSKGAVSRLEREALLRLVADNDGKSLVACLHAEPEREEAIVEWRLVSTDERIAIVDVRLIDPVARPEEAACIDELMKGLEVMRERYHPPFLHGDQRRTNHVPLGIVLRAPTSSENQ
jgi:hypothetical protein